MIKTYNTESNETITNCGVKLKDKNGNPFSIKPENKKYSPLDVDEIGLNLSREEVIEVIRESRKYK